MVIKIIKNEFKNLSRGLLPLYILVFVFSWIFKLFNENRSYRELLEGKIYKSIGIVYGVLLLSVVILTILFVILRFNGSVFKDTRYLPYSFEYSSSMIIFWKFFVGLMFIFLSLIVLIIGVIIPFGKIIGGILYIGKYIVDGLMKFFQYIGVPLNLWIYIKEIYRFIIEVLSMFITLGILSIINLVLLSYCAVSLSNMSLKFKGVLSFVYFLLLILSSFSIDLLIIYNFKDLGVIIAYLIISRVIMSFIYFYISSYILQKKLNIYRGRI